MFSKVHLCKMALYKSGGICIISIIVYALTKQFFLAAKVGLFCELATALFYLIFETAWEKYNGKRNG